MRAYGEMLEKCRKELSNRDLKDVPSNKLLDMAVLVEDRCISWEGMYFIAVHVEIDSYCYYEN